jgi:SSS family solute:Na+ symporter
MAEHWSPLDSAIFVAYLLGMLAIGVVALRRIRVFEDWFLAGRGLTTPILVATLVSTYYGLDVTFGASETAFEEGISAFFAYSAPFYLAYAACALLVAPRLKRLPARTLPEAVAHFYGPSAGRAAAFASFFYSAPILSVAGMGLIGHTVFGWDPLWSALGGAAIALTYTLMGGLLADALTDTVQFAIMCVSAAIAAAFALHELGGYEGLAQRLDPALLRPAGNLSPADLLVYGLVALSPLVEPAFYQRIFAGTGVRAVRNALLIGLVIWAAYDWIVVTLGLVGRDFVATGRLDADLDSSAILLHVCAELLPAGVIGLFVAGLFASAMSTVDSYTLIAAGNLVYDGVQPLRRKPLSDRALLHWTRLAAALTLAVSLLLALRFDRLRDAWIFMATVLMSTVLVPMMIALFLPRAVRRSAGAASAWTGFGAAMLLFALFETLGAFDSAEETRMLLGFPREYSLLVALPASAFAYALACLGSARRRA